MIAVDIHDRMSSLPWRAASQRPSSQQLAGGTHRASYRKPDVLLLMIGDDHRSASARKRYFARCGVQVKFVCVEFGRAEVERDIYDCVVINAGLPAVVDGFAVCRELRSLSDVAIVVASARADIGARVAGFDAGADDVVAWPLSTDELMAVIRHVLASGAQGRGPCIIPRTL
jgi:DNA-binding response OmpR family regulator